MDILYRGRATAGEVIGDLPAKRIIRPSVHSAGLEEKGHVPHEEDGVPYVYIPATPRRAARKSALKHLVDTFSADRPKKSWRVVLGGEGAKLSEEELDRIADLIDKAKKEGSR